MIMSRVNSYVRLNFSSLTFIRIKITLINVRNNSVTHFIGITMIDTKINIIDKIFLGTIYQMTMAKK